LPTYAYICPKCAHPEEVVKPMSAFNSVEMCPVCSEVMERDYRAETPTHDSGGYARELHSDALAIHPSQRQEHERLYPDVPLDSACRPVLSNYHQHKNYLEKRGIEKVSHKKEY